ncbi:MAG: carbonic anhydrase [Alphaproteobacteria bacterium]|uniref:Carbonic anhydrase n=1 Tax=Candidatus Nitrobium versatile TaxID=2884831 RepID=A0A953JG89_9BACT|nr:carbonic anhydrase [Candidatus Nitrobium versatile]
MEKLYKGIHTFQNSFFKKEEDFFRRLSERQTPEVLFITCADSRVDPNLVTQSRPGELFIVRNVGNIVPPHNAINDKNSVAAAMEFAVMGLKVTDIIVCGHSNCGAMQALFMEEKEFEGMHHLKEWMKLASPVRHIVNRFYPATHASEEFRRRIAEEENILVQLSNIQTYPFVLQALEEGTLHLHGWYYDIRTGDIFSFNPSTDKFEKIQRRSL